MQENKEEYKTEQKVMTHRVITMLDRREIEFLDKLGKDSLFSTGYKLSYNQILRALINFAMEIDLSADKVESMSALKEKMKNICRRQFKEEKDETHSS